MTAQIIQIDRLAEAKKKERRLSNQYNMLDKQAQHAFMALLMQRKLVSELERNR